jgi:hypothetical protein
MGRSRRLPGGRQRVVLADRATYFKYAPVFDVKPFTWQTSDMTFIYNSPVGIFSITPRGDRFALSIGDLLLGTYARAEEAAQSVHAHTTGYEPWDRRTSFDRPADLTHWDTLERT